MKLQKQNPADYNLLIVQDLWKPRKQKNLAAGINKIKCKYGYNDKTCETCRNKYKDFDCFLE